jgi:hypothetical protein
VVALFIGRCRAGVRGRSDKRIQHGAAVAVADAPVVRQRAALAPEAEAFTSAIEALFSGSIKAWMRWAPSVPTP